MNYHFDFSFLWDPDTAYWRDFLWGTWLTIKLTLAGMVCGFLLGTLFAIGSTQGGRWTQRIIAAYVEVVRNTPLLVQTFWLFFGLTGLGIRLTAFAAAIIALTLNISAYTGEIIRAGIESIRKGQIEAGESLGLSRTQVLRDIVLPPAIERVVPALAGQFVLMMLATSIMAQISAEELMAAASRIQSESFRGFEIYIVVAVIYLVLTVLLRLLFNVLAWIAFPRRRRLGTPV
ncbi:amino acid ABC transporter permease [Methylovirgula sp. 4M-Z18]|uniref:amino acid ABC transporter permease n=1 Tax=Methylovirgula sp. 4M-Z18 TaxID=2293567 RepID=UPI000E2E7725|nr:amino acid ABC transporter permease [Methylovirgula sp. 4M-Z18]RFB76713.1 amino acid ABC transporter permease [Methylovirgula sp. 4M-Z18]